MDKANIKILISDDSILARKQLKDILSGDGFQNFIEATNGQEAIDLFKAQDPDIVFLDIVMPVKDGITAIKEIREIDSQANIIVASSLGTQTQLKAAIMEGAKEFVQKPLQPKQILKIVSSILEGR